MKKTIGADNFKLGAHLEFQMSDEAPVYVLDHFKNRQQGRIPQLGV